MEEKFFHSWRHHGMGRLTALLATWWGETTGYQWTSTPNPKTQTQMANNAELWWFFVAVSMNQLLHKLSSCRWFKAPRKSSSRYSKFSKGNWRQCHACILDVIVFINSLPVLENVGSILGEHGTSLDVLISLTEHRSGTQFCIQNDYRTVLIPLPVNRLPFDCQSIKLTSGYIMYIVCYLFWWYCWSCLATLIDTDLTGSDCP